VTFDDGSSSDSSLESYSSPAASAAALFSSLSSLILASLLRALDALTASEEERTGRKPWKTSFAGVSSSHFDLSTRTLLRSLLDEPSLLGCKALRIEFLEWPEEWRPHTAGALLVSNVSLPISSELHHLATRVVSHQNRVVLPRWLSCLEETTQQQQLLNLHSQQEETRGQHELLHAQEALPKLCGKAQRQLLHSP
jgi:hypothetical protein